MLQGKRGARAARPFGLCMSNCLTKEEYPYDMGQSRLTLGSKSGESRYFQPLCHQHADLDLPSQVQDHVDCGFVGQFDGRGNGRALCKMTIGKGCVRSMRGRC